MDKKVVSKLIDKKIKEDDNFVKFTFYELRVKNNLSSEETEEFLILAKNYFQNNNYKVYFTNSKYYYHGETKLVQSNELLVAVKESKL